MLKDTLGHFRKGSGFLFFGTRKKLYDQSYNFPM